MYARAIWRNVDRGMALWGRSRRWPRQSPFDTDLPDTSPPISLDSAETAPLIEAAEAAASPTMAAVSTTQSTETAPSSCAKRALKALATAFNLVVIIASPPFHSVRSVATHILGGASGPLGSC